MQRRRNMLFLHRLLDHRQVARFGGVLLCAAIFGGLSGCSFIFDFNECEADADCESFDDPGAGEFFVCSSGDKCVLEPERECRTDSHCEDARSCEQGVCVGG